MSRLPAEIAVVGLSCWYPGASSPRALWENVLARRQEFRAFLEERMPAADYFAADPTVPDRTYGTQGAFLDGFRFDAAAWRVPKASFAAADITHWLALEVASRVLTDAGHEGGERLPRERTAVIVGNSLTGEVTRANSMRLRWPFFRRLIAAEARKHLPAAEADAMVETVGERFRSFFPPTGEDTLAGALSNTIAGRICGAFDFGGGGYVVDGACASSMLAVCTAATALEEGRVDAVIAGGVDVSMDPFELVGFAKARALTPTDMRVYDKRGNGFIPGEGCGFVLLKRLADARAAGDRVYAVLQGWGISSDGRSAITAPRVSGQARAISAAWARAGQPDVVEGHGTGTTLGDKVELSAIAQAAAERGETRERVIGVTSLKSLIGHTKAAAGIGAFLKAVMAANRRVVPPFAGCADPNPVFDTDARALYPLRRGEIRDPASSLKVGASAMGFGGINSHVVVVSADPPDARIAPSVDEAALLASRQESELFVLGGADAADLRAQALRVAGLAGRIARSELADLSAELLARLPPRATVRGAVIASSPAELEARMTRLAASGPVDGPELWWGTPGSAPRVGFLCPGQGSQEPDAAAVLLARDPSAAARARELAAEGPPGLWEAMFPPADRAVSAAEVDALRRDLADTRKAQPALALSSLVWADRLAALGVTPSLVAGHSLGELTAFALAGALSAPALIRLATRRGAAMAADADRPAGMVSLRADVATVGALCASIDGFLAIANVNTPAQVVVAGEVAALDALERAAAARDVRCKRLPVSNGFHSALVESAAQALAGDDSLPALAEAPAITLLSTLQPEPIAAGHRLREHVAAHVRAPVDFVGLVRRAATAVDVLVEVGSGRVLSGLVEEILGASGPRCLPVEAAAGRASDLQAALAALWVRGCDLRWEALHRGRLIRPFVAAQDRAFLANPCEAGRADEVDVPSVARAVAPPKSADEVSPVARTIPVATSAAPASADLTAWMLAQVVERTGFDAASVRADQLLADDLNLDSIKSGELIAAAARHVGVADRMDPAMLIREPISAIAEALVALVDPAAPPAAAPSPAAPVASAPSAPGPAGKPAGPRWARTFGLYAEPVAAPTPTPATLAATSAPEGLQHALRAAGATLDPFAAVRVAVITATGPEAQVAGLRALVDDLPPHGGALIAVSRLDGQFGLQAPSFSAPIAGFVRSISLERPHLRIALLDAAPSLSDAEVARAILAVRPEAPGVTSWGVGPDGWTTPVARPISTTTPRRRPLQFGDLVLVTGGARGITAACAEALARTTGVRLALVGSTPAASVGDDVHRLVGRLAVDGFQARYWSCDLANAQAVRDLVAAVVEAQGPIAAVVHGAGRNTPRRVETVSEAEALAEIAPKLLGLHALLAALPEPPKLIAALTSIIGVSGMTGNAWYAFANDAADQALAAYNAAHPSTDVVSLAYGVWSEIGMGARMGSVAHLARLGIGALDPDEGVARFLAMVTGDPGVRQPILTAELDGLPTWPAPAFDASGLRFLDGEVTGAVGVETRARLTLHPDRDRWLRDHDFAGSLLLPTVFGLEAMAQAALRARGRPGDVVEITDVELPTPVVVGEAGTAIEVRALVREQEPDVVDCEVRSEQSGFARAHFSATLRFGALAAGPVAPTPDLPVPIPPLDPRQHLYGGLLFQGPAFQRMGLVRGGVGREMVFDGLVQPAPEGRFVIGDPFFRDALLQAGQVLVAQDDALPVRIGRITLGAGHAIAGERAVWAAILDTVGRRHIGAVRVTDADGRVQQELHGYEVQILASHPERPDTEALLRPQQAHWDRAGARVAVLLGAHDLPAPACLLAATALGALPQAERRRATTALHPALADLSWRADGRPELPGREVSIAHDTDTALVAWDAAGCDLEPIATRADWSGLLGAHRAALVPALRAGGDDLSTAGTRVWAAGEALHKAGAGPAAPSVLGRVGDAVSFASGNVTVVTFPVFLPRCRPKMLAVAVRTQPVAAAPVLSTDLLSTRMERGEHERMVTRFVVAFDESGSLSGRVPAITLAVWMGRLRELALTSLRAPMMALLADGRHGMVTQNARVQLTGEAAALDAIEAHTWVEDLRPSTCLLRFSFARVLPDGRREPVGEAEQRFGWVEVVSHGVVRAANFPDFLMAFLTAIHRPGPVTSRPPLRLPHGRELSRTTISTTLVDGNVVGNLYYAGYFKWAQRAIDRLVHRAAPEVLRARGGLGELAVTALRLEYLREAMPFDELVVTLHAAPSTSGQLGFDVVFSRAEEDGSVTRLGVGHLDAVWTCGAPAEEAPRPAWIAAVEMEPVQET